MIGQKSSGTAVAVPEGENRVQLDFLAADIST